MRIRVGDPVVIDSQVRDELRAIYSDVMWLAKRPGVTPTAARAWYTHIRSGSVRRSIRQFSGKISERAARAKGTPLRLEHFKRMQTTLTKLVGRHLAAGKSDPGEFVDVVLDCERVHIVTFDENYLAMRAKGDYRKAGIKLVAWKSLSENRRAVLWRTVLRGKVANAGRFAPRAAKVGKQRKGSA